jgi:Zn-dependent protease with chaperone function
MRRALLAGLFALAAITAPSLAPARAQDTAPESPPPAAEATAGRAALQPVPPDSGPVAVPEPSEKAMRYYRSGNVLWWVATLWGFAVPALLLWTGFSARMRTWAGLLGRRWFLVLVVYFLIFSAVTFLLDLPLAYYSGYVRPHAYELSNQTLGKWSSDLVKGLMVGTIAGALFLWIPYLLLRKSPRRWWLYSGLASVPVIALLLLVSPLWIEPLFNEFGPMKDKVLEARIVELAGRARIAGGEVYEVEKSVDTKTVNAYVSGFGETKRIVLWDTLLQKLEDDQVVLVMGHEMGHYVLQHIPKTIGLLAALIIAGLFGVHRTAHGLLQRHAARFGFDRLDDVASLPLVLLLFNLFAFVLTPALLAYSRWQEHEADRFGLEITQDNRACGEAFVRLQEENLSNPRPGALFKLWRASHPPLGERIDFCNSYRPWEGGAPLRYGDLFESGG